MITKWNDLKTAGFTLAWYGRKGDEAGYRIYEKYCRFICYRPDGTRLTNTDDRSLVACKVAMRRLI